MSKVYEEVKVYYGEYPGPETDNETFPGLQNFVDRLEEVRFIHPELIKIEPDGDSASSSFQSCPTFKLDIEIPSTLVDAFEEDTGTGSNAWTTLLNRIFWIPSTGPRIIGQFDFDIPELVLHGGPRGDGAGGGDS